MKENFENFREKMACRCNCGFMAADGLLYDIFHLLIQLDDVEITSGCRCDAHNKSEGGLPNSYHTKGMAMDIKCADPRFTMQLVRNYCEHSKINYVDIYKFNDKYLHIEIDEKKYTNII